MRAPGHVIFKLLYNKIYQMKNTMDLLLTTYPPFLVLVFIEWPLGGKCDSTLKPQNKEEDRNACFWLGLVHCQNFFDIEQESIEIERCLKPA